MHSPEDDFRVATHPAADPQRRAGVVWQVE